MEWKMMLWLLVATSFGWNSVAISFIRNDVDYTQLKSTDQPYSRISGPNGYCVDVKDGNYSDGNPIILWPCKSGPDINQLWAFQSDGTIRSNGMCLASDGFHEGSNIVIYNCTKKAYNIWSLGQDGEVLNPSSGLVLTAISGAVWTELALHTSVSSSFQTWRVGNDTKPRLVSISGFRGLCMQAKNNAVWIEECESSKNGGKHWLIYPDGTIRPQKNPNGCLSYHNLVNRRIVVLFCGLGPSSQRWLFTENGTILNERSNLVMDVKGSDPSLKEIIVYPATGKPNQKWNVIPLSYSDISGI
ncbi:Beta-galactoside-specific lectin 1 [Euphorbia peplus]|nr:Beta-galactoside-specific lectin 1 [Euphorbia peplus]